jgi:DNA-binding CsgD family transcriptional regulator
MDEMERGMILLRPTPVTAPSRGLWALLRTLADLDGDAARAEVGASGLTVYWIIRGFVGHADAVALGRQGDRAGADAAFAAADADLAPSPWYRHYCRRLVAEAAIADGWGEPVAWLRDALAFFDDDWPRVATACRSLLHLAGAPVPRKRDPGLDVPPALRSLGVTRREMDVLALVVEGRSTRDIATRLYLSPKTVERHVANLAAKAGVDGRAQLIAFAAGLTPDTA